jgi:hypothetical protein
MTDKPNVLDLYVGGKAATADNATGPGYKIQVSGPQIGTCAYLNDVDRVLIDGPDIDNITFGGNVTNSEIRSRVPAVLAQYGVGNVNNRVNGVAR